MAKILSIDTSTSACTVALSVEDKVIQRHKMAPREHAQLILPWVDSLLAEAGIKLHDLDAIAVGQGPGSFTGLRIGVGVAQGLAVGASLPIILVSSLHIIAQTAYSELNHEKILVAQDARMNEVYWAAYSKDKTGLMKAIVEDQLRLPSEIELPEGDDKWCLVGDAWNVYSQVLAERLQTLNFQPAIDIFPKAQCLSQIASQLFNLNQIVSPEDAMPVYLRGKGAWTVHAVGERGQV